MLISCCPFVLGRQVLFGQDYKDECVPPLTLIRKSFKDGGVFPRWNPTQFAGRPILGSGHGSNYYPPMWWALAIPPEIAIGHLVLLHLVLAASGMYRLTRSFGCSRPGGVIAGLAYSLGCGSLSRVYAGHLYFVFAHGLAPWLYYSIVRLYAKPTPPHIVSVALWVCSLALGGAPQLAYPIMLVAGAIVGLQTWEAMRNGRIWLLPTAMVVLAGLAGAALASIELLPALEATRFSTRSGGTASRQGLHDWSLLSPEDLISWITPYFPWSASAQEWMHSRYSHEKSLHVGVLPLLVSVASLSNGKRPAAWFFVGLVVTGLVLAMGVFHRWAEVIPGYGYFRIPARLAWLPVLAVPVLAAFGWDAFADSADGKVRRRNLLTIAGIAILGLLFLGIRFRAWQETLVYMGLSLCTLAAWFGRRAAWGNAAAVFLIGAEGCVYALGLVRTAPPQEYFREPWYASHIGAERTEYRVLDLTRIDQQPVLAGFRLMKGYGHPILRSTSDLYSLAWEGGSPPSFESIGPGGRIQEPEVLRLLNVRWIVAPAWMDFPGWVEMGRAGNDRLLEDPSARAVCTLEHGRGTVRALRPDMNSIIVDVALDSPDDVIISEAWMPGWHAWSSGRRLQVDQEADALLRVGLPAGNHSVLLTYDPPVWHLGMWVSGVTAGLLGLLIILPSILTHFRSERPLPS